MRFWGMLRFTFGETIRKGTLIFYFAISTVILILLAFGIGHSPGDPNMVTIFGTPFADKSQPSINVVEFLLIQFHSFSVFWITLFGVFGIAGLIPRMLDKGTADLFLSKPLSRAELLMARVSGAVSGIAANLIFIFVGTWCIFGLKLGVWHWGFLMSVLYVIYAFLCFFSVVTIAGMIIRSSGITIMFSVVFTVISWGLEVRVDGMYRIWDNVVYHRILDALYYLTPQLNAMLENSSRLVGRNPFLPGAPDFTYAPFIYSFFSATLLYLLAIWYFYRKDY